MHHDSMRGPGRVVIQVSTVAVGHSVIDRGSLTLDIERDGWSLADLHELAMTTAEAAGILNERVRTVRLDVSL
jgi:hypothetical protein